MEKFPANRLIFRLDDFEINDVTDCYQVFDEIEAIAEDNPEYLVIFETQDGGT